jgi:hypothetical protein
MRAVWLWSVLASLCLLGAPQHESDPCLSRSADLYPVSNVMSVFRMCRSGVPGSIATFDNAAAFWGDGASISILKALDAEELAIPENIRAYLCLVRKAFYDPAKIWRNTDKSPNVTFFVLDYLEEKHANNTLLKKEIESVRQYIRDRAIP